MLTSISFDEIRIESYVRQPMIARILLANQIAVSFILTNHD